MQNLLTLQQWKRMQSQKPKRKPTRTFEPRPTWDKYIFAPENGALGYAIIGEKYKYQGTEAQLQKAAANLCDMAGLFWFHAANEGKRNPRAIAGQGMKKGVSDCIFMEKSENGLYIGAAIELKAEGGRIEPEQIKFLETAYNVGNFAAVCWNLEGFEACLRYLWPSRFTRFK